MEAVTFTGSTRMCEIWGKRLQSGRFQFSVGRDGRAHANVVADLSEMYWPQQTIEKLKQSVPTIDEDWAHGKLNEIVENAGGDEQREEEKVSYKIITSAELEASDYAVEYLVSRTLVAGQPCIIAGGKKTLKTSIMIDLAITLATGGCFLGKLPARRRTRTLVMSGESGLGTIQETAGRIAKAAGRKLSDIDALIWSEDLPKFGHLEHLDAMVDLLDNEKPEVVMIDPTYLCMPSADASNLMAQGELLRGMNNVVAGAGAMMILAHHTRKRPTRTDNTTWEPPELDDIAWAGFPEWARQWLLIGRRASYDPGSNFHELWLSVGGSAGHSALWAVDVDENRSDAPSDIDPFEPAARGWSVDIRSGREAREAAKERAEKAKREKQRVHEEDDQTRAPGSSPGVSRRRDHHIASRLSGDE